jgi:PilX N-terminal
MQPTTRHPRVQSPNIRDERGMALIVALMSMLLLTTLGLGLLLTTLSETMISANYREGGEALYAADAGVERVMQDLLTVADWNRILTGNLQSSFTDGAAPGQRTLPDGTSVDLVAATNMLNCNKTTTCTIAEMNAFTPERGFGVNNPRWQLYAYSPLTDVIETATVMSPFYVAVWIADDYGESDGDPTVDGGPSILVPQPGKPAPANLGRGVVLMRAEAFGPQGSHSVIEVTLAKTDTSELERGYTGQRGQDEQNRRARKAAVQTPGKALTRSDLDAASTTGGFTVR